MKLLTRASRLPLIASPVIAGILLGLSPVIAGQTPPAAAPASAGIAPAVDPASAIASRDAWLYKGSDIAPDPAWHFGTLKNGLRYAIRRNGVPPGQISVRVRIDAGSLYETDAERGYAHLIEHLSFRGSKYVPDGEAKRIWQRMGTTFGSDTNAQTTTTQTVFKLDLPSATPAGIDESLKIMSGMVSAPNITPEALNAERPAVLAEQREQPGAQVRYIDALNHTLFAGQPLADRSPIGNIKTLEAATAASVKAFHDRWYRPSRVMISVAGDADPAMIESLIAKYFGGWQGIGPAPADPDFGKPDPKQPTTATIVEPSLPPRITMAVVRPWEFHDDTMLFNQQRMVDQVALAIINRRLEARARAGGSYIAAQAGLDDPSRSANVTIVSILPVGADWEAALRDVRSVIAAAQDHAPTQAEIDRELADLEVSFRTSVDTARAEAGSKEADDMVQALDIRETTTAPDTILKVYHDAVAKKMFNPAAELASTKKVFQGTATRALLSLQSPDDSATAKLATALKAKVSPATLGRAQGAVSFDKLPAPGGKPSTVVSREKVTRFGPDMDLTSVSYSNGSKLMVYSTNAEDNRIYVRVRFGRGYNAFPADKATPAWAADLALVEGGIGKLRQGDLDQMTAGRRIGLDFDIEDDAFSLSGQTSPSDFADQMKLLAAELAAPGWDPNPVLRAKSVALSGYAGLGASPGGVLTRDLERLLRDGDKRWGSPSREQIMALTPQSFRAFWEPLMKSGPVEVQVFGDIPADVAIATVGKTIGALPPRTASTATPPPVRFPAHDTTPVVLTHDGPANQAAAVIAWPTGSGIEGMTDSRRLDVLAAIFSDRLFDQLRSQAGASYSPNVSSTWPIGLPGGGRMVAIGQVAPENVPLFFKLSREIAADLVAKPVSDDELKRTIGPMLEAIKRQSTGNQFWMLQLTGASYDPRRIDALTHLYGDVTRMTAADLQATAQKYLVPGKDWTMDVVPKAAAAK
ncbi:M16 family metallopeptidase [Sphingomonas sp. BAUL-RG-20F-R05-02]|uniref:M16 family metallopeptidase n=1 Tax=Sphingomonas sp. BAUL-RG-20F-R05-02 TaxID=2914830 RepID=UPI001F59BC72|nr:M16 family metallopeptidase [Sphingomonas sp. BAUL-RG-20F-R05-02]